MVPLYSGLVVPFWSGIDSSGKTTLKDARADYGEPTEWDEEHAKRLVDFVERGKMIKDYAGPFSEGERDNLTYQLFAEAKNRMIHPDVMLEAIQEAAIDGGLGDDTVERKMESAYYDGNTQEAYGSKVGRYWSPNHLFKIHVDGEPVDRPPVDPIVWKAANLDKLPKAFPGDPVRSDIDEDKKNSSGLLPMQSFDQLLAKEPQPVTEIIPDRIEQGVVNFLSGPGGSHKSRLALQYCVCIGARIPVFGKMPMEVMPIYVGAEDGEDEIIRRMHKLAKQLGVHPDDVRETTGYLDRTNQDNALVRMHEKGGYTLTPFHTQLGNYVAGLPGHKFLVLDSCYDFVRFEGNSKVNEDAVNIFVKEVLGGFCQDTNSTLLIPWHPSYSGQVRGDGSGWSVAWHNSPRVRDQIKRNASGDAFELTAEKRNHGALPEPITLHYSDGALLPKAEIELSEQRATDRDAVKKMAVQMAKRGLPIQRQRKISKTELDLLQEKFDCQLRNKEVKDILNRAVVDGELQYVRGSKYQSAGYYPSDAGQELARDAKEKQKPRKN